MYVSYSPKSSVEYTIFVLLIFDISTNDFNIIIRIENDDSWMIV